MTMIIKQVGTKVRAYIESDPKKYALKDTEDEAIAELFKKYPYMFNAGLVYQK